MVSSRESAKASITERENEDPELDVTFSNASKSALAFQKEENRHAHAMKKTQLGKIGEWIGDDINATISAALFVIIVGFVAAIGCWIAAAAVPTNAEFWGDQAGRALTVGSAAVAYLFGRGGK